jgi:molybdate transport system ATP-binding protein
MSVSVTTRSRGATVAADAAPRERDAARGITIELGSVGVRRANRWVLRDVTARLLAGRRYALIGENGAGKTQFLKLLATDVWPTPTGRESLRYLRDGRPLEGCEAKARIAYLVAERQDRYARYGWNPQVGELLATGLHGTDLALAAPTAPEWRRIERIARRAGIAALLGRRFLSLSYGQKRIALLARALIGEPDWLLLDEFYNGLDAAFRERADRLLALARARGQAWVVAAHRAADLPAGTGELLWLRAGRLVAIGPLERRHRRELDRAARAPDRVGAPRRAATAAGPPLVELRDVDLYVDYRRVLRAVSWTLRAGEHWAVVGANGAGKSSFLKLLYGDLAPALGGRLERDGCAPGAPIDAWKRNVGYVSADLQADYDADVDLATLVASGARASIGIVEPLTAVELASARTTLRLFGLAAAARRRPRELSYGQLRRALIARAVAHAPRLLLLDEPLTGLDPRQRAAVKRGLARLARTGTTLVVAVHHLEDLPVAVAGCLVLESRRVRVTHTMRPRVTSRPKPGNPKCP